MLLMTCTFLQNSFSHKTIVITRLRKNTKIFEMTANFFLLLPPLFVPKLDWRKAGNRHIEKALSQRLICGVSNLASSKHPQGKAMFQCP